MFKNIIEYIRLSREIKKSEKLLSGYRKHLNFLLSFEVIETYSWHEETRAMNTAIYNETLNVKKLYASRDKLFGRRACRNV